MQKISDLIVASGEGSSDMRYGSKFAAPDAFVYFGFDGVRGVIVSPLERDRAAAAVPPGTAVLCTADFNGNSTPEQLAELAAERGIEGFRVPGDFPLALADDLRERGLTVTAERGAFFPARAVKSEWEIAEITRAQRLAEKAVRAAIAALAEAAIGADDRLYLGGEVFTSERLRQIIDLVIVAGGGVATGTIAAGGAQGAEPHNAGSGPLFAHAPIVMDVFPRLADSGYWGDLTRTVVRGRPSPVVARAYEAVKKAREHCKSKLAAGVVACEVHQEACRILREAGFQTGRGNGRDYGFFHGLGHGVGLDIHEAPRLAPRNAAPLRAGEVVTVEPGLYYPEWGGIRLEDLVVIRPDGIDCLTRIEDFLVIEP